MMEQLDNGSHWPPIRRLTHPVQHTSKPQQARVRTVHGAVLRSEAVVRDDEAGPLPVRSDLSYETLCSLNAARVFGKHDGGEHAICTTACQYG